jgi:cell division transport system permease protein
MGALFRLLKETFLGFRSSPLLSVLSVLTITFTLFLSGLFFILYVNLNKVITDMDQRVQLVIYFRDDVPREDIERIRVELYQRDEVKSAVYVSKEEAIDRFRHELGADSTLLESLSVNPLPASIEVGFKEGRLSEEKITSLARGLEDRKGVESVDYGGRWIGELQLVKTLVAVIGTSGAVILLTVAVIVIGSAIRMTVFSRRTELLVMKMVGSTYWTIQGPLLMEGMIKGACGGALAAALAYVVYRIVDNRLIGLAPLPPFFIGEVVLIGIFMGICGSYLSVRSELRKLW